MPDTILELRSKAVGMTLFKGTLNVRPIDHSLNDAVSLLGDPDLTTDQDNRRNGPLKWWKVALKFCDRQSETYTAYVVRHIVTRTSYLELMSNIEFRKHGIMDGDAVEIHHVEL